MRWSGFESEVYPQMCKNEYLAIKNQVPGTFSRVKLLGTLLAHAIRVGLAVFVWGNMTLSDALTRADQGFGIYSPHPSLDGVVFVSRNGIIQGQASVAAAKAGRYEHKSRTEPGLPVNMEILTGDWLVCDQPKQITLTDLFPEIDED